jgi:PPOX class probable F420-dependent enzyme
LKQLPDSVKKLIETKTYANIATLMPDGTPQVTQTWIDHEGDIILINTVEGSQKSRNVRRNPKVGLDIVDPTNPYYMAVVRGKVIDVTFDGAEEHIDKMAKKYTGTEKYEMRRPGMRRLLIKIEPTHVTVPWERPSWQAWQNRQPQKQS